MPVARRWSGAMLAFSMIRSSPEMRFALRSAPVRSVNAARHRDRVGSRSDSQRRLSRIGDDPRSRDLVTEPTSLLLLPPAMVTASLMDGSGVVSTTVPAGPVKRITFGPAIAFALMRNCRSDPAPLSFVFVTALNEKPRSMASTGVSASVTSARGLASVCTAIVPGGPAMVSEPTRTPRGEIGNAYPPSPSRGRGRALSPVGVTFRRHAACIVAMLPRCPAAPSGRPDSVCLRGPAGDTPEVFAGAPPLVRFPFCRGDPGGGVTISGRSVRGTARPVVWRRTPPATPARRRSRHVFARSSRRKQLLRGRRFGLPAVYAHPRRRAPRAAWSRGRALLRHHCAAEPSCGSRAARERRRLCRGRADDDPSRVRWPRFFVEIRMTFHDSRLALSRVGSGLRRAQETSDCSGARLSRLRTSTRREPRRYARRAAPKAHRPCSLPPVSGSGYFSTRSTPSRSARSRRSVRRGPGFAAVGDAFGW